ncbi:hypothetical protein A3Q56_05131 [Intoshia linei]|uniref:Uncharacterized protein n=1 Tax=Intoshia linei TaxID=1819745 RepID=A0A177AYP5_9BILA|nr:hypothetical protein A3Q56_05131 [Intoshia linei]
MVVENCVNSISTNNVEYVKILRYSQQQYSKLSTKLGTAIKIKTSNHLKIRQEEYDSILKKINTIQNQVDANSIMQIKKKVDEVNCIIEKKYGFIDYLYKYNLIIIMMDNLIMI